MYTVLVIGACDIIGKKICQLLSQDSFIHLLLAGSNLDRAQFLARELGLSQAQTILLEDHNHQKLTQILQEQKVQTVLYVDDCLQGKPCDVATLAMQAGCHYIDLISLRTAMTEILSLDAKAKRADVTLVSGACVLPALSSAVVDYYISHFSHLEFIRHGIASGFRSPNSAEMRNMFSCCGQPFTYFKRGQWVHTHGWMGIQHHVFPEPTGQRPLVLCDTPDLALFPQRYPTLHTVTSLVGFSNNLGHRMIKLDAWLIHLKILSEPVLVDMGPHIIRQRLRLQTNGSGGMFVQLGGLDREHHPLCMVWHLMTRHHHDVYLSCGAAVALIKKLARGIPLPHGAMPCVGLVNLEEYLNILSCFDVSEMPPKLI